MAARSFVEELERRTLLSAHHDQLFVGDFDGDGDDDMLSLIESTSDRVGVRAGSGTFWMIQDGQRTESRVFGYGGYQSDFDVCGAADVNGDGIDDVVVRGRYGGRAAILGVYLMSADGSSTYQEIGYSFGWQPVAFGDVNGDGTDDVIWESHLNGYVGAWTMRDGKSTGWVTLGQADLKSWRLREAKDINGDGRADLIWTNSDAAIAGAWMVGDSGAVSYRHFGSISPEWEYVGAEGAKDGRARILWCSETLGRAGAWEITLDQVSFSDLGAVNTGEWTAIGAGDLDGNGHKDLVWEDQSRTVIGTWLLGAQAPEYRTVATPGTGELRSFGQFDEPYSDLYEISQEGPTSVAIGQYVQLTRILANAGDSVLNMAYGQIARDTAPISYNAVGPVRYYGGPERIVYDPAIPADVKILSVTGLRDHYAGVDRMEAAVSLEDDSFTPGSAPQVILSANGTVGDSDDIAVATELASSVEYGTSSRSLASRALPAVQGSYYVIITAGGSQWTSATPVEFSTVTPDLQIAELRYDHGTYVEHEPVLLDVVLRNVSGAPIAAGVPIEINVTHTQTYSVSLPGYIGPYPTVTSPLGSAVYSGGLAAGESRTVSMTILPAKRPGIASPTPTIEQFTPTWPSYAGSYQLDVKAQIGDVSATASDRLKVISEQQRFFEAADLDGDGDEDLLYYNSTMNSLDAWILQDGRRISSTKVADAATSAGQPPFCGVGDLDGDGTDEVLVWSSAGLQVRRVGEANPIGGLIPSDAPSGRNPVAIGDVNGDHVDDIIWGGDSYIVWASIRNPDGSFTWREMGQNSPERISSFSSVQPWALSSVADLDADGDDDLIWNHNQYAYHQQPVWVGVDGAWLVSDGASQWVDIEASRSSVYGDLNGDGRTDFIDDRDGVLTVRLMQPDLTTKSYAIARAEEGWRLVAVADINNDGTDDLVWRSPDHGAVKAELMRGGATVGWQEVV